MADVRGAPTLGDMRSNREEILRLAAARGAHNLRIFGSVARGEARQDSDIDLLVEMDADRTALDVSELILDLQEALGRPVDIVELRRSSPAAESIRRQSVPL